MSSVIAFEPYVVRTGRGDPFVQSAMYSKNPRNLGISFGPDFILTVSRGVSSVAFLQ
ncbi:MAG: hypothetical protein QXO75_03410 [Nitrososphaerota archaeon]